MPVHALALVGRSEHLGAVSQCRFFVVIWCGSLSKCYASSTNAPSRFRAAIDISPLITLYGELAYVQKSTPVGGRHLDEAGLDAVARVDW